MNIYEKRIQANGKAEIIQKRANGRQRKVSGKHQGYLAWLVEGNTPAVVPYIAPPAPPVPTLAEVKAQKIQAVTEESARRCADIIVFRVPGFPEKFTDDVRSSMLGRFAELTLAKTEGDLEESEAAEIVYLMGVFAAVKGIQAREFVLKQQVANATTKAQIANIAWTEDTGSAGTQRNPD